MPSVAIGSMLSFLPPVITRSVESHSRHLRVREAAANPIRKLRDVLVRDQKRRLRCRESRSHEFIELRTLPIASVFYAIIIYRQEEHVFELPEYLICLIRLHGFFEHGEELCRKDHPDISAAISHDVDDGVAQMRLSVPCLSVDQQPDELALTISKLLRILQCVLIPCDWLECLECLSLAFYRDDSLQTVKQASSCCAVDYLRIEDRCAIARMKHPRALAHRTVRIRANPCVRPSIISVNHRIWAVLYRISVTLWNAYSFHPFSFASLISWHNATCISFLSTRYMLIVARSYCPLLT